MKSPEEDLPRIVPKSICKSPTSTKPRPRPTCSSIRDVSDVIRIGRGEHEPKLKDAPFSLTRDYERDTTNPQGIADSQYAEHRRKDR